MKLLLVVTLGALVGCADEAGILLCVDAPEWEDGDEMELQVTFASGQRGPTCEVVRRAATSMPYCVSATRGEVYGYAMGLQAIWSRGATEVGRRVSVVPFQDDRLVEADLVVGDCCTPSTEATQCVAGGCTDLPAGTRDFFGVFVEDGERCEE
jgi:hypothetical protein